MTWYIHRRADNGIASAHREQQPGYADEALDDNAPEIVAFFAAAAPPPAGDVAASEAAANPFMRAIVKLLAAQSTQIFGAPRTVPQVIAILKAMA